MTNGLLADKWFGVCYCKNEAGGVKLISASLDYFLDTIFEETQCQPIFASMQI